MQIRNDKTKKSIKIDMKVEDIARLKEFLNNDDLKFVYESEDEAFI